MYIRVMRLMSGLLFAAAGVIVRPASLQLAKNPQRVPGLNVSGRASWFRFSCIGELRLAYATLIDGGFAERPDMASWTRLWKESQLQVLSEAFQTGVECWMFPVHYLSLAEQLWSTGAKDCKSQVSKSSPHENNRNNPQRDALAASSCPRRPKAALLSAAHPQSDTCLRSTYKYHMRLSTITENNKRGLCDDSVLRLASQLLHIIMGEPTPQGDFKRTTCEVWQDSS